MGRIPTIPIVLLLLTLVSFSVLPSSTLVNEVKAQVPPPLVRIDDAVDGKGVIIPDGGTTSSTSITFTFSVTNVLPPVQILGAGITPLQLTCSLDNSPFTNCGNTSIEKHTYSNLALGKHNFFVHASNNFGSSGVSFTWTVVALPPPPPPLVTTITAFDAHNAPVQDGATVTSTPKFIFTTTGGVPPYRYECRVVDPEAIFRPAVGVLVDCIEQGGVDSGGTFHSCFPFGTCPIELRAIFVIPGTYHLDLTTFDSRGVSSVDTFTWILATP